MSFWLPFGFVFIVSNFSFKNSARSFGRSYLSIASLQPWRGQGAVSATTAKPKISAPGTPHFNGDDIDGLFCIQPSWKGHMEGTGHPVVPHQTSLGNLQLLRIFVFSNLYLIQGDQFFWSTNRKKHTHTMLWSWRILRGLHFWWRKLCLYIMFLFGLCLKRSCTKVYLVHFLWIEPKEDVAMMKCTSCNSPSYQPMIFKEFLANAQGWRSGFFMVSP